MNVVHSLYSLSLLPGWWTQGGRLTGQRGRADSCPVRLEGPTRWEETIGVIVGHDWNRPVRLEGTVRLEETSGIGRDLGRPEGTGTIGTGRDDWKRRRLGRGGRRGMLELAKPQS